MEEGNTHSHDTVEETIYSLFRKKMKGKSAIQRLLLVAGIFISLVLFVAIVQLRAPYSFPLETSITITEGSSLVEVTRLLHDERVIRSEFLFRVLVAVMSNDASVFAGDYYFHNRENAFSIARMVTTGDFGLTLTRVTIPEGATLEEMALIYGERFDKFDSEEFSARTEGKEGYLFPDTYLFLPNVKAKEVVKVMEENFRDKLSSIEDKIKTFGKPLEDIIIMASLLEEEARLLETRRTISGILWTRIEIGMPLQVDAVFPYIIGKNTFEVTLDDLKVDSPYNTYKYAGLPVGPISNPGLDSIIAAVTPTPSDYLYYLSDRDGNMHYASTFEKHKENKFRYLR